MNQGNALVWLGRLPEALTRYDEAIALWDKDIAAGTNQFTPNLLRGLRNRFTPHRRLEQWDRAAGDVVRALELTEPFLQGDGLAELVRREQDEFVEVLQAMTPEEWERLYPELGEWAEVVRGLMEPGATELSPR